MSILSDFSDAVVSLGRCNHANAVMDDWDGKDFYVYKNEWAIFKASREHLTVELPASYRSAGSKFELLNKQHMIDVLTENGIRTK